MYRTKERTGIRQTGYSLRSNDVNYSTLLAHEHVTDWACSRVVHPLSRRLAACFAHRNPVWFAREFYVLSLLALRPNLDPNLV